MQNFLGGEKLSFLQTIHLHVHAKSYFHLIVIFYDLYS